jgi:hypothetical protein
MMMSLSKSHVCLFLAGNYVRNEHNTSPSSRQWATRDVYSAFLEKTLPHTSKKEHAGGWSPLVMSELQNHLLPDPGK